MKINFSANTQGQDGFFSCERLLTALRVHSAGSPKTSSFICCTCGHCVVRAVNTSHPFLFPTHYTLILLLNGARQRSNNRSRYINTILYSAAIHIKGTPAMHIDSSVSYTIRTHASTLLDIDWCLAQLQKFV